MSVLDSPHYIETCTLVMCWTHLVVETCTPKRCWIHLTVYLCTGDVLDSSRYRDLYTNEVLVSPHRIDLCISEVLDSPRCRDLCTREVFDSLHCRDLYTSEMLNSAHCRNWYTSEVLNSPHCRDSWQTAACSTQSGGQLSWRRSRLPAASPQSPEPPAMSAQPRQTYSRHSTCAAVCDRQYQVRASIYLETRPPDIWEGKVCFGWVKRQ